MKYNLLILLVLLLFQCSLFKQANTHILFAKELHSGQYFIIQSVMNEPHGERKYILVKKRGGIEKEIYNEAQAIKCLGDYFVILQHHDSPNYNGELILYSAPGDREIIRLSLPKFTTKWSISPDLERVAIARLDDKGIHHLVVFERHNNVFVIKYDIPIVESHPVILLNFPQNCWNKHDSIYFYTAYSGNIYLKSLQRLGITDAKIEKVSNYEGTVGGIVGNRFLVFYDKEDILKIRSLKDHFKEQIIDPTAKYYRITNQEQILIIKWDPGDHTDILIYNPFTQVKQTILRRQKMTFFHFSPSENAIYFENENKEIFKLFLDSRKQEKIGGMRGQVK